MRNKCGTGIVPVTDCNGDPISQCDSVVTCDDLAAALAALLESSIVMDGGLLQFTSNQGNLITLPIVGLTSTDGSITVTQTVDPQGHPVFNVSAGASSLVLEDGLLKFTSNDGSTTTTPITSITSTDGSITVTQSVDPQGFPVFDVSSPVVDINVQNLSYDDATKSITLTETDGTVHTIDVSDLVDTTLVDGTTINFNGAGELTVTPDTFKQDPNNTGDVHIIRHTNVAGVPQDIDLSFMLPKRIPFGYNVPDAITDYISTIVYNTPTGSSAAIGDYAAATQAAPINMKTWVLTRGDMIGIRPTDNAVILKLEHVLTVDMGTSDADGDRGIFFTQAVVEGLDGQLSTVESRKSILQSPIKDAETRSAENVAIVSVPLRADGSIEIRFDVLQAVLPAGDIEAYLGTTLSWAVVGYERLDIIN